MANYNADGDGDVGNNDGDDYDPNHGVDPNYIPDYDGGRDDGGYDRPYFNLFFDIIGVLLSISAVILTVGSIIYVGITLSICNNIRDDFYIYIIFAKAMLIGITFSLVNKPKETTMADLGEEMSKCLRAAFTLFVINSIFFRGFICGMITEHKMEPLHNIFSLWLYDCSVIWSISSLFSYINESFKFV
jgi:hypothetical protein